MATCGRGGGGEGEECDRLVGASRPWPATIGWWEVVESGTTSPDLASGVPSPLRVSLPLLGSVPVPLPLPPGRTRSRTHTQQRFAFRAPSAEAA